jgi:hypothetical protein
MVTQIPEMGTYYSLLGKWGAFFSAIADLVGLAVNHIIKNGFNIISKTNYIWFFRTYTVENSSSSLSAKQCSKVDKYQSNKNSKP